MRANWHIWKYTCNIKIWLKGLPSKLNSERIPSPQNTSTISQTQLDHWPWWSIMPPQTHLCSELCNIWLHVLQYSHDHPLARHFSQMKTLHSSLHAILLVWTSHLHQGLLQIVYHLFPGQMLHVSALHYSTRSQEGFQMLASACALHLTTHYLCLSISGAY